MSFLMPGNGRVEYDNDVVPVPPIPLFFDRVNEGRPPKSNSFLFQLPFEILEEITRYLSEFSLASLSLVSKDCCQLARSCWFASVQFNFGLPQIWMIEKLQEEAREREANHGSTISPSIGACIRRLRIVSYRLDIDLAELNEMGIKERKKRVRKENRLYFGDYLPSIELILAGAFPHLELLDMQDNIPLPRRFFNALAISNIQHLKLRRVNISEEFEIALPQALAHRGWPLRTLHFEVLWEFSTEPRGRTALLCTSLLQLCAPTLEKFVWITLNDSRRRDLQSLAVEEPPRFVRLRELSLHRIQFSDHSTLKLLIFPQSESGLKVLEVDANDGSLVARFLESCGMIRSLETFVWDASCLAPDQPFTFLRNNSQLSKLRLPFPQTPAVLDEGILPILSQSFQELRSLSLAWEGTSISISALELIGTLRGLQQIHLSTGFRSGWRHDWLIKHREMREYLKELRDLKKLAFSRDTYEGRWGFEEAYYSFTDPISEEIPEDLQGLDDLDPSQKSKQIWERQHRRRILTEADDYVRVLPRLEWLYFGKIRMGVIDAEDGQGRQAVALSEERDDGYTLLRRMFGRETSDD